MNSEKRRTHLLGLFFVLTGLLIFPWSCFAEPQMDQEAKEDMQDASTPLATAVEHELINTNVIVAKWFDGMADNLDLFIAGKRLTNRKNESGIKIENSSYYNESDGPAIKNQSSLNAALRLPNVEQYWQVKFTDYDETKEKGVKAAIVRPGPRPKNYGASVGAFQQLGNVRTAFQPRVALQDPLSIAHSLTFESTAELESCRIVPRIEFYATPDSGVGTYQEVNFHFKLSKIWSFTLINDGNYEERKNLYSVSNGFTFGQIVTKTAGLSYSMIFSSNNRPGYHLENYVITMGWGHLLYKSILDYSISPRIDFNKATNFTGTKGLTFNVGLNF